MQNEFYEVIFEDGAYSDNRPHFFKTKYNAFYYLWQAYLKVYGDRTEEELMDAKAEMNDYYYIEGFGEVIVRGFED